MSIPIVYSSRTGNTEQAAWAMAGTIPGSRVYPIGEAPRSGRDDAVFVGYRAL